MSTKQSAQALSTKSIEMNPLAMLERGIQPPTNLPRYRKSAAIGNLYYEYVQNVPTFTRNCS